MKNSEVVQILNKSAGSKALKESLGGIVQRMNAAINSHFDDLLAVAFERAIKTVPAHKPRQQIKPVVIGYTIVEACFDVVYDTGYSFNKTYELSRCMELSKDAEFIKFRPVYQK